MPAAEPTRLVLIRHGESVANAEGRFTRDGDEPLTPLGREQALATATRQVAARAGAVLDRLAARHPGEEVVVVSHGGVMAALRAWIENDYSRPPVSTPNAWGYEVRSLAGAYLGVSDIHCLDE